MWRFSKSDQGYALKSFQSLVKGNINLKQVYMYLILTYNQTFCQYTFHFDPKLLGFYQRQLSNAFDDVRRHGFIAVINSYDQDMSTDKLFKGFNDYSYLHHCSQCINLRFFQLMLMLVICTFEYGWSRPRSSKINNRM